MFDIEKPDSAQRLEMARKLRGFSTAKDAAKFFGWVYETYIQHEQGTRGLGRQSKKYAEAFRVSEGWLLTGEGQGPNAAPPPKRTIPIVGYVGAGAEVFTIDDHAKGGGIDDVAPPHDGMSSSTVAVRVRGASMEPVFYDGDLIFYDQLETGDMYHLLGRECVVALSDDRKFIKILKRRQNGEWFLHSYNSEPILDVSIAWAAKVKFVQRA